MKISMPNSFQELMKMFIVNQEQIEDFRFRDGFEKLRWLHTNAHWLVSRNVIKLSTRTTDKMDVHVLGFYFTFISKNGYIYKLLSENTNI